MTVAIAKTDASMQPFFTPDQERMILSSFLGGASKQEASVLMEVARVRRLNPLLRQIHFVKRWDSQKREEVWSYQTSIDGLRAVAERTGRYQGQTKAEWCGKDGVWRDVWLADEPPAAARVGVYKQGFNEPCYAVAKWTAFVQTKKDGGPTHFWSKMGDLMLAKCAEALAIRRAFPEDTSGLYTEDEMGEAVDTQSAGARSVAVTPSAADRVSATAAPPVPGEGSTFREDNIAAAAKVLDAEIVRPNLGELKKALWKELTARGMTAGKAVTFVSQHRKSPPGTDLDHADYDAIYAALGSDSVPQPDDIQF